jgi:hypothetical protein
MNRRPAPVSLRLRGNEASIIDRALAADVRVKKLVREQQRLLSKIGAELELAASMRDLLDVLRDYRGDGAGHARVDALEQIRRAELAKKSLSVDLLVVKRRLERQRTLQRTFRQVLAW